MKNLFTGLLVLSIPLMVVVAWFLYGQGWDRTSAMMVIWRSLLLIPLVAGALCFNGSFRSKMELYFGKRASLESAFFPMLLFVSGLLLLGIGLPYLIVFVWQDPPSPFEELWMMLGGITVTLGGLIYWVVKPQKHRHWFAISYLVGCLLLLLSLRALIFSFF